MEHYNIVIKQLSIVTELTYCAFFNFRMKYQLAFAKISNFRRVTHVHLNGITYSLKIYGLVTLYSDLAYF